MTVVADKKDWKSETCTPAILEENKYPYCGKTYGDHRNHSQSLAAESGPWPTASKNTGISIL